MIIKNNITYAEYPGMRIHHAKKTFKYLLENGWVKKKYDKNEIFDYCDIDNNSLIGTRDKNITNFLSNKFNLYHLLKKENYIPKTYIISNGKWLTNKPTINNIFFVKHPTKNCSLGNFLLSDIKDIENHSNKYYNDVWLVQPSIKNLLLYNNKKFDLRMHVIIISNNYCNYDFELVFFKKGLIRSTVNDFNENDPNKYNQLTNLCVQKNISGSVYKNFIYFDNNFPNYSIIYPKILKIIKNIFKKIKNKLINCNFINKKIVTNFGIDFIINNKFDVFLLEFNDDPSTIGVEFINEYLAKHIYTPLAKDLNIIHDFNIVDYKKYIL